jgi:hypothetical protein
VLVPTSQSLRRVQPFGYLTALWPGSGFGGLSPFHKGWHWSVTSQAVVGVGFWGLSPFHKVALVDYLDRLGWVRFWGVCPFLHTSRPALRCSLPIARARQSVAAAASSSCSPSICWASASRRGPMFPQLFCSVTVTRRHPRIRDDDENEDDFSTSVFRFSLCLAPSSPTQKRSPRRNLFPPLSTNNL